MKQYLNQPSLLAFFTVVLIILFSGCDALKLQDTVDKVVVESDSIGINLGKGLVTGIDTTQLDSIVNRLVGVAGNSMRNELDSVSFRKLSDSLNVAVQEVLSETMDSLKLLLSDTTALDALDAKLQSIISNTTARLDQLFADMVPNALNDQNLNRIYTLRDSLLGPTTAGLLKNILLESVGGLIESEQLDSLITRVTVVVDETTGKVGETAQGISRTVVNIGVGIGIIILALALFFLTLWLRRRSISKQQNELLVNLTKAIDAIPTKESYDQTIAFLQKQINTQQHEMLNDILEQNANQYEQKQKYKDYHQRLIQQIKASDKAGEIRQQLFNNADDEDFRNFLEQELVD